MPDASDYMSKISLDDETDFMMKAEIATEKQILPQSCQTVEHCLTPTDPPTHPPKHTHNTHTHIYTYNTPPTYWTLYFAICSNTILVYLFTQDCTLGTILYRNFVLYIVFHSNFDFFLIVLISGNAIVIPLWQQEVTLNKAFLSYLMMVLHSSSQSTTTVLVTYSTW